MYVEETISKYEKYINPAQAKLFRFMGLASVEGHAEGWTITDSEGKELLTAWPVMVCLQWVTATRR